ncbi:YceI family protein [Streptomyces sp. NPDC004232]|uniref:YceI family protein n=1 Tax=Streptomyces sp. NPDC004232 TaxID=3154454 RepID=UPI001DAF66BA|nr:YceI family protein [Streptomyces sp. tea 10]
MFDRQEIALLHPARYAALTGVYSIDPGHSTIGFSVRHAMVTNVRGKFTVFEGLLKLDGTRPTRSEAYLSVQTGSVDTGSPDRDAHVTGPDFLDSATFPLMSFRSGGIVDAGDEQFRMTGLLRIKDVELPIRLDLHFGGAGRDTCGLRRIGFEGTAVVRRSDWGLDWNAPLATGSVLVSDKVKLNLDISAVRLDRAETAA